MANNNHNRNNSLNPFSPQHPAQPEYFADRKRYLDDFRATALNSARLRIPTPVNYAILGTSGEGKTSLLYKFRQIVLEDLKEEMRGACIYYPLSPQYGKDWDAFTTDFLRRLRTVASTTYKTKIAGEARRWDVNLNLGVVGASRRAEEEESSITKALEDFWNDSLKPSGARIAFVLIDDLHYFSIRTEDSSYLNLKTTFQELVNRRCNYSLVVTAPSSLFAEIAGLAEPTLRFFRRYKLEPFTFDEAKEAIQVRLQLVGSKTTVEDVVIRRIVSKTVGHPYLIMLVMYEMMNQFRGPGAIGENDFQRVWPRHRRHLS